MKKKKKKEIQRYDLQYSRMDNVSKFTFSCDILSHDLSLNNNSDII
jgi:hypothetical protein